MKEARFSNILMGEGTLLIQCGELLLDQGHEIKGVISNNPFILQWAKEKKLVKVTAQEGWIPFLKKTSFDYLFSIYWFSIIPEEVLELPRKLAINFHDGPLPKYAGMHVTSWALMNGEKRHGVTWHVMTPKADSGDRLKQHYMPVEETDSAFDLNLKCYQAAMDSFTELIDDLASDQLDRKTQDLSLRTYFPKYKRPYAGGLFSWDITKKQLKDLVRGLHMGDYPNELGTAKFALGETFIITETVTFLPGTTDAQPGNIILIDNNNIQVAIKDSVVVLKQLKTLSGFNLSVNMLKEHFNLKKGHQLPEIAHEERDEINRLLRLACKHEVFWVEHLERLQPLQFPHAFKAVKKNTGNSFKTLEIPITNDVTKILRQLDKPQRNVFITSAWCTHLALSTNQSHFDIGFYDEQEQKIFPKYKTYFALPVPLRVEVDQKEPAFSSMLKIKKSLEETRERKTYPLDLYARHPSLRKETFSHSLDFSVVIEWLNKEEDFLSARDEGLHFSVTDEVPFYHLAFNENLLNEEKVIQLIDTFSAFLSENVSEDNMTLLAKEPLYLTSGPTIKYPPLEEWNDTLVEYPRDKCMHDLFIEQAKQNPKRIAAVYENEAITYEQLEIRSARLANYLKSQGVGNKIVIGVFVERSLDLLVTLIAIMRTGAAYVPLDPAYPVDRLSYMLEDAAIEYVITQSFMTQDLPDLPLQLICLDQEWEFIENEEELASLEKVNAENLAYVIYTSGSTGRPKGVKIGHRSLTNFLCSMAREPGCDHKDHILALTTICFDIAALELYLPLTVGGCVEILPTSVIKDGIALKERLESSKTTILQATPATWQMLLIAGWEGNKNIKILSGGEALSEELAGNLLQKSGALWNLFGPTETTIWSTATRIKPNEKITIGRPIANTSCYILDKKLQLSPIGEIGELYIGGDGIALGYWDQPKETLKRFIKHPFDTNENALIYKTGDLARHLPDGRIIYCGRADFQVKIRGYRIEIGEIENALKRISDIEDAVVVVREDTADKCLVAFLIAKKGLNMHASEHLHQQLKQWLPDYMLPSHFVYLKAFPLTLNNKVNRKLLSEASLSVIKNDYGVELSTAENETKRTTPNSFPMISFLEQDLLKIVAAILKVETNTIHPKTNIGEYGYNSIRFTGLSAQLNKEYGIKTSPAIFYQHSTIKKIAIYLYETFSSKIESYYQNEVSSVTEEKIDKQAPVIRAHTKMDQLKSAGPKGTTEAVAIVGISAKMPGSANLECFAKNLMGRKNLVRKLIAKESVHLPYRNTLINELGEIQGGFIDDIDKFDASFFQISPREAELMDPRQRLLLQAAWGAMEDAGHSPSSFSGTSTGVFMGITGSDYWEIERYHNLNFDGFTLSGYASVVIANRISYLLNLQGPSNVIDTACSSSLVALHRAVNAIQKQECDAALAGGANLILSPFFHKALSKGGYLSPDGYCKTFDRSVDGYVRSEGVGVFLLRPLSKAIADGDPIYAVIKGSAENHGGRAQSLSAPSADSQAALLSKAYKEAEIDPRSLGYMEVHGTGTSLGDPIEINGLKEAFKRLYKEQNLPIPEKPYCGIGSVKTYVGHLEAAAGVASILSVILSMKYKKWPGLLHFKEQNPYIDLEGSPFYIVAEPQDWEPLNIDNTIVPRRAGVSSFGFSGSNAHVILEEYVNEKEEAVKTEVEHKPVLIVLSAMNKERLQESAKNLAEYIQKMSALKSDEEELQCIAYTLQTGREALQERLALWIKDKATLMERLIQYANGSDRLKDAYQGNTRTHELKTDTLLEGIEGETFIRLIIEQDKLHKLAQLWTAGVDIDWQLLYSNKFPKRLSLPTYPFAKESYWIPVNEKKEKHIQKNTFSNSLSYYKTDWRLVPAKSFSEAFTKDHKNTILVLYRQHLMFEDVDRLSALFPNTLFIFVKLGIEWKEWTSSHFEINATRQEMYHQLFKKLIGNNCHIDFVLYCGVDKDKEKRPAMIYPIQDIFFLVSGIKSSGIKSIKKIVVAYEEAEKRNDPSIEAIGGYTRSLQLIGICLSKVGFLNKKSNIKQLIITSLKEFYEQEDGIFHEVYYEGNDRYAKVTKPLETAFHNESIIKEKGIYWITGGAGGLGRLFAFYLVEKYQAKVILTGRFEKNKQHIKLENDLQEKGGEGTYYTADVCDSHQMEEILSLIHRRYGKLNGIIHAAGSEGKGRLDEKSWPDFEQTLSSKMQGTIILDEVTRNETLDFFVMFSSVASIIGDFGQCDYAIGNRFMDEYIHQRLFRVKEQNALERSISINWPLWEEGSMGFHGQEGQLYLKTSGFNYLGKAQGMEAFEIALKLGAPQCAIFSGEREKVERILGLSERVQVEKNKEQRINCDSKSLDTKAYQKYDKKSLSEQIKSDLKRIAASVLKAKEEDFKEDFNLSNFGFDSIALKDFALALTEQYKFEVLPLIFFEYDTIAKVSQFLEERYHDNLKNYYSSKETADFNNKENKIVVKENARESILSLKKQEGNFSHEPIAIVGMSGVMPQSSDLETFWQHLEACDDLISEVPSSRWDWREYYGDALRDKTKTNSKWGGFIKDIDQFDPLFFGISPREAELMDPQHRLFIEAVWKTIEDAGYSPSSLSGQSIALFAGVEFHEYQELLNNHEVPTEAQMPTGNALSMIPNRVSYLLNLNGPSEAIDTACSGSLIAIHRCVRAIRSGEVDSAIAGGVSIMLDPQTFVRTSQLGILSPDGRCKTFDKKANGYVKGEGVGALWLKRLSDAKRGGDSIYGLIIGSAENHGGKAKSLTAPNAKSQGALLAKACNDAKIEPETISYIEIHGTGTELGDPIEVEGLKQGFYELAKQRAQAIKGVGFCGIGSVKTNIGHLEPASGIAGLFKVVLSMKYKKLPGTVHLNEQNPYIKLENSPFYIVEKTQEWNVLKDASGNTLPRRAGINSFGFGGANAHVIIEEYVEEKEPLEFIDREQEALIVLSAKSKECLRKVVSHLSTYVRNNLNNKHVQLDRIAYTLKVGRDLMKEKLALVVKNKEDLLAKLEAWFNNVNGLEDTYSSDIKSTTSNPLLESDEGMAFIENIVRKNDLKQIAQLWVNGVKINWALMYGGNHPKRISLPPYPFEKERYWIPNSEVKQELDPQPKSTLYFFEPIFEDRLLSKKSEPAVNGTAVIFDDDSDLYDELSKALTNGEKREDGIILVKPGKSYKKISDFVYTINLEDKKDYIQLLKTLKEIGSIPNVFIYNWMKSPLEIKEKMIRSSLMRSFYSLLYLSQGLMELKFKKEVQFIYLKSAQKDREQPLFNGLAGFIKTLKLENPKYKGKLIEVINDEKTAIQDGISSVASILQDELGHAEEDDIEVRYCKGRRQVKVLIEHVFSKDNPTLSIKRDGVYLVTGGVGGLGLIFARYLIEGFDAKVILLGRSELTPEKAEKLKTIKAKGGEAVYLKADVSNHSELQQAIQKIREKYHCINGVIHSAGIIKDTFILKKHFQDAKSVLAAKTYGTLFLDELTSTDQLDFFMMFSSTTAVTGNVGQCDYGYANSFMDNYAVLRSRLCKENKRPGKTLAINWPLWRDGGMHVDEQTENLMRGAGLYVLEIDQGIKAFEEGLSTESSQLVVAPGLKAQLETLFAIKKEQLIPSTPLTKDKKNSISHDSLFEKTEERLRQIFADEIKLDPHKIDPDEQFEAYGIDSILIQRLNVKLESFVGTVSKTLFFEYQTLSELTHYFLEEKILAVFKEDKKSSPENMPAVEDNQNDFPGQKKDLMQNDSPHWKENKEALFEKILDQVKAIFAKVVKIKADKIDVQEPFENYGVDSILIQKMNIELEENFGSLPKTLFYEYQTIFDLVEYLIDQDETILKTVTKKEDTGSSVSLNVEQQTKDQREEPVDLSPLQNSLQRSIVKDKSPWGEKKGMDERIAIIGIDGRYPGAANLKEYWNNLRTGKTLIKEVPIERWDWREYKDPLEKGVTEGKSYNKWGTFLEDFDQFDPLFFNISPREAETMDPQERIFLQTAWKTFEDAGYTRISLADYTYQKKKEIGVFVGVTKNSYSLYGPEEWLKGNTTIPSSLYWSLANRVSYLMNLHGPSMPIDTACSSSLVAVHEACEAIKRGDCGMALVGGVNLYLHPSTYVGLCQMRMLSYDGKCRSFGEGGYGFVPGEGVGALLLKPLGLAKEDNDHIYGTILSSFINHDGKTNGYTVPNPKAQKDLIRQTLDKAAISARTISYIEAHGTGTQLGDPIEITGLTQAYREDTHEEQYCAIGSVKSNIGHLESGAGISGIIKVLLQMKHKQLVPSLNADQLNPNIDFKNSPFKLQQELEEWESPVLIENGNKKRYPRRSGISSFGAGGVNAHVIIEEYTDSSSSARSTYLGTKEGYYLIPFSAKNKDRLKALIEIFIHYLEAINIKDTKDSYLSSLAYTLQVGRESMVERLALIVNSRSGLLNQLRRWITGAKELEEVYQANVLPRKALQQAYKASSKDMASANNPIDIKELKRLAQCWLSGAAINWDSLYGKTSPKRLSLPTYPFAKERYWFPIKIAVDPISFKNEAKKERRSKRENCSNIYFYRSSWEQNYTKDRFNDYPLKEKGIVLILNKNNLEKSFIDSILKEFPYLDIVQVKLGTYWNSINETLYEVDKNSTDDYERLFCCLQERGGLPAFIIYNIFNEEQEGLEEAYLREIYTMVRGIKSFEIPAIKKIIISYSQLEMHNAPWLESLGGYIRSLRLLGLPFSKVCFSETEIASKNYWGCLFKELYNEDNDPFNEIQYKESDRYLRKVSPLQLDDETKGLLVYKGIYLITGGAGGLGKIFASYLCEKYAATVILTGRSSKSEKHIQLEQESQAFQGEIIYMQCNICDEKQMEAIISTIKEKFTYLNGVIHAAGLEGKDNIDQKSWSTFKDTLDVKMKGTEILDNLTKDEKLDFFVTFSSTAAVLGDFGQCDYAIANRFTDEYVELRRKKGRPGKNISINWPLWRDGGMGKDTDQQSTQFYLQVSGLDYLETNQGIEIFETILSNPDGQYIIMAGKQLQIEKTLGIGQPEDNSARIKYLDKDIIPESSKEQKDSLIQNEEKDTLSQHLDNGLRELISIVGRIDKNKIEDTPHFSEYGFESLSLKGLADLIESKYKIHITPIVFFEHNTLAKLREFLLKKYKVRLMTYYSGEIKTTVKTSFKTTPFKETVSIQHQTLPLTQKNDGENEPVAIVGMSGIFPGSSNLNEFWKHLEAGNDLITEIPDERWDWRKYYDHSSKNKSKTNSKWGGFINDFDKFDPLFFSISPKEAELMDPQHRLFLQTVWHAIEDAGHCPSSLSGKKIGVFAGVQFSEYEGILASQMDEMDPQRATGNIHAILANRISYLLGLRGPSEAINTACSASLVAVHRAVRAVQTREVESAFAGGVSLALTPETFVGTSQLGILSPDGRCKTFDKSANGYVKGEGVGALWLKPLSQAQADRDIIHGVIIGSAENHGGDANSLTAPNPEAQAELLVDAYMQAKVNPETIGFIETHGTGTELGDPIEIQGLKEGFAKTLKLQGRIQKNKHYCGLGTVKTNIGHLEPASGIVGIIKILLSLKHKRLPKTLHLKELNPYVELKDSPFYIVKQTQDWDALNDEKGDSLPRRAGVSSFGFGGSNAHIVLEEYPYSLGQPTIEDDYSKKDFIILLSASNEERLRVVVKNFIHHLDSLDSQSNPSNNLKNIAYTLAVGRDAMVERLALIVNDIKDLMKQLKQWLNKNNENTPFYQGNIRFKQSIDDRINSTKKNINDPKDKDLKGEIELHALAHQWILGVNIDWNIFYQKEKCQRAHLPTYPFIKKRYWPSLSVSNNKKLVQNIVLKNNQSSFLHPLLHENHSTLKEQRFSVQLNKELFFLKDHKVNEQCVLPGVAYLEMARKAGEISNEKNVKQIKNAVWMQPISIGDENKKVYITLHPNKARITYKVFTLDDQGKHFSHAQGELVFDVTNNRLQEDLNSIDLESIHERCREEKSAKDCYAWFLSQGLNYGSSFRPIQRLKASKDEILAYMELPRTIESDSKMYILHPSLMDGALQSVAGLNVFTVNSVQDSPKVNGRHPEYKNGTTAQPALPFALETLDILKPLPHSCYAYIKRQNSFIRENTSEKYNIQILDKKGNVCVRMTGFSFRALMPVKKKDEENEDKSLLECLQLLASGDLNQSEAKKLIAIQ